MGKKDIMLHTSVKQTARKLQAEKKNAYAF